MDDAEVNLREVDAYGRRMDNQSELTRWADSTWAPLVRGQRVRITHGDFSGDFRVVDITPGSDGSETYYLEPAAELDAREARARIARDAAWRDLVTPGWQWPAAGSLGSLL